MARLLVFDVNETLLDVRALAPDFEQLFGERAALTEWFGQLLQAAFVATLTGAYRDFGTCGRHALDVVAQKRGVPLSDEQADSLLQGVLRLPPHPEVPESLARLKEAGFTMTTLTNSAPQALRQQMENSGLAQYFDHQLSVDVTRHFKPAPNPYHMVAAELGVDVAEMRMVAAHNWDVTGAIRAGCHAAFVARPGAVLGPLDEKPDIIAPDMAAVAERIIEVDQPL